MAAKETVKIYGHSDDLVEIEGTVPGCDEYGSYDKPLYVELSTGDVFKAEYTPAGIWRVTHENTGSATVSTVLAPVPEGDEEPDPYTDTVTATGDIQWVDTWRAWPATDEEVADKVADVFGVTPRDVTGVKLDRVDWLMMWGVIQVAKRRR